MRYLSLFPLVAWLFQPAANAQTACADSSKLACLLPKLYSPGTLAAPDGSIHYEHYAQSDTYAPLNGLLASDLTRLGLASPASGFVYRFNSAVGVFERYSQSFGPILTERAETIGRGGVHFGVTYQRFAFGSLDGIDLNRFPVLFVHRSAPARGPAEPDFITAVNSIKLRVNQMTAFATVGITDRLDLSVAVPMMDVSAGVDIGMGMHRVTPSGGTVQMLAFSYGASGTARGIGDVLVRAKATVKRFENSAFAAGVDVRLPTGDALNFLGAGTPGMKPFAAYSIRLGRLGPHVNAGYEINGSSVLMGGLAAGARPGAKGHLPNQLLYGGGTDVGVSRRLTLAFDVLGQRAFGAPRAFVRTHTPPGAAGAGPNPTRWSKQGRSR